MNSFGDMAIQFIGQVVSMALVAIFIENFIFTRALGSSTALVIIRKKNSLVLFSVILTAITVAAGLVTYFLQPLVNQIPNKGYYIPLIYVAVIGLVYIAALFVSGMLPPHLLKKIKPMIHISAFNCVVLGVLLLSSLNEFTLALASAQGSAFPWLRFLFRSPMITSTARRSQRRFGDSPFCSFILVCFRWPFME